MKKSNRNITLTIIAITAALTGLIWIQVSLLLTAVDQKEQIFDKTVLSALKTVSQKLEVKEVAGGIYNVTIQGSGSKPMQRGKNSPAMGETIIVDTISNRSGQRVKTHIGAMSSDTSHRFNVEIVESTDGDSTFVVGDHRGHSHPRQVNSNASTYWYGYTATDSDVTVRSGNRNLMFLFSDTSASRKKRLVTRVIDRLSFDERLPIEKRIDKAALDSLLKEELASVGIDIPYYYGVFLGPTSVNKITNDSSKTNQLRSSTLTTGLFPSDALPSPYELSVILPDRNSFVIKEIIGMAMLSLFFLICIVFGFIITIRTILVQKQFAQSMTDFINNMTHEFKTPISTIALATEAIAKPEVSRVKKKLQQYNTVIVDEISRMRLQVEKILQMAILEEGEKELRRDHVDLHELIATGVKGFTLQIENRNGAVTTELKAEKSVLQGDAVHLSNMLNNVLDNALKYSKGKPSITISTRNERDAIVLSIEDKGIGMEKRNIERVFEKYYRVPTGNTHDVKGFGIGLSYVKLIAEAHGGNVRIESSVGHGTSVLFRFPVNG